MTNFDTECFENEKRVKYKIKESSKIVSPKHEKLADGIKLVLEYDERQTFEHNDEGPIQGSHKNILLEDAFQLFVRDSDASDESGFRKRTFAFIIHGEHLLRWMQTDDDWKAQKIQLVQSHVYARRLRLIDSDSFEFLVKKENCSDQIMRVNTHFMTTTKTQLYKEELPEQEIKTQNFDFERKKIVILLR